LSAKEGVACAQCNLGGCYESGATVDRDYIEAVRLYQLAAMQNDADAQCNVGKCYETGKGMRKSRTDAVHWYRLAIEHGSTDAKGLLEAVLNSANMS
jgi:TPR repeat protein